MSSSREWHKTIESGVSRFEPQAEDWKIEPVNERFDRVVHMDVLGDIYRAMLVLRFHCRMLDRDTKRRVINQKADWLKQQMNEWIDEIADLVLKEE